MSDHERDKPPVMLAWLVHINMTFLGSNAGWKNLVLSVFQNNQTQIQQLQSYLLMREEKTKKEERPTYDKQHVSKQISGLRSFSVRIDNNHVIMLCARSSISSLQGG